MTLPPFTLHRPANLEEATALLQEHGDDASIYMGGTELLLIMKLGLAQPEHLIDAKRVAELLGVADQGGSIRIGAGVTHRQLERDDVIARRLPELAQLEAQVANVRVRTVGTLGGSLCFAEPHSDPATLLMALGASVELASAKGRREVSLTEFCVSAFETALEPSEIMTGIVVPAPATTARIRYERIKFRERPVANAAVVRNGDDIRIVVGAVGGTPVRITEAERILAADPSAVNGASDAAAGAVEPYEDLDGSVEYKRHLVKVLVTRALEATEGSPAVL